MNKRSQQYYPELLKKCPTGIKGLDELTNGGLPQNRTSLIIGGPGCGKTVFSMEFLLHGIKEFKEPGVMVSFEEDRESLYANFASMGNNLQELVEKKMLYIEEFNLLQKDIMETGDFNLDPVFLRLEYAIRKIGAKRVVLDTID